MSGIDETIVATAVSSISDEFKVVGEATWVGTAYLITTTAFQPLYGKLADVFGRRPVMLTATLVFLAGSVGCALAGSESVLTLFRAVAGLGAGGMVALSFIILSDLAPISNRSLYLSMLNVTFGASNALGPLAGGVLVDKVGWRWVFMVNVPIGILALIILWFSLPRVSKRNGFRDQITRVDGLGSLTLALAIILLVLGGNWGGKDYPWGSWQVILCLGLGGGLVIVFGVVERHVLEPILPWGVLTRNVVLSNVAAVVNGVIMFSFMYYWPLFHMTFHKRSATRAGLEVLPILVSDGLMSALSGVVTHRTGTYRWMMRLGMGLILLGVGLLSALPTPLPRELELLLPLTIGLGIGLNTQTTLIAAQADQPTEIATITSFNAFSASVGGVLGLAVMGAVFDNALISALKAALPTSSPEAINKIVVSLQHLHNLDVDSHSRAITAYATAYQALSITILPFAALGLMATLAITTTRLHGSPTPNFVSFKLTENFTLPKPTSAAA
ncbi:hypothetical protein L0F63_005290, partial [Massospora cicadina]